MRHHPGIRDIMGNSDVILSEMMEKIIEHEQEKIEVGKHEV